MDFQLIVSWVQARLHAEERGAALVEYGLLVALIAVVCLVVLGTVGTSISAEFSKIAAKLT